MVVAECSSITHAITSHTVGKPQQVKKYNMKQKGLDCYVKIPTT